MKVDEYHKTVAETFIKALEENTAPWQNRGGRAQEMVKNTTQRLGLLIEVLTR